jgi:hypothetical protein
MVRKIKTNIIAINKYEFDWKEKLLQKIHRAFQEKLVQDFLYFLKQGINRPMNIKANRKD